MRGIIICLIALNILGALALQCGDGIGSCKTGYCCSKYGYCGTTSAYCGNGCQSKYGECLISSTKKTTTKKITTKKTTTKKTTTKKYTTTTTTTKKYTTTTTTTVKKTTTLIAPTTETTTDIKTTTTIVSSTLLPFITTTNPTPTNAATTTKISTSSRCGPTDGICSKNRCCSKYGYCGTTSEYCGTGCQSEFGRCGDDENGNSEGGNGSSESGTSSIKFKFHKECVKSNYWALTFDDGSYKYDKYLLDLLKEKNVKATFFINGDNFGGKITSPERTAIVKRMYDEGHIVGSHTWKHIDVKESSENTVIEDMAKLDNAIYNIIGKKPAIMRLPYGSGHDNERVANLLKKIGFNSSIMWNVDTKDYDNKGDIDFALERFEEQLGNSIISLNHNAYSGITKSSLVDLIEAEIDYMLENDYIPVTIDKCIGLPAYRD